MGVDPHRAYHYHTALGNTTSTSNRTLSLQTITDASGVARRSLRVFYYSKELRLSSLWDTVSGSTWSFTIDYSLVGGGQRETWDFRPVVAQDTQRVTLAPTPAALPEPT